jgi:hypothetical protein
VVPEEEAALLGQYNLKSKSWYSLTLQIDSADRTIEAVYVKSRRGSNL